MSRSGHASPRPPEQALVTILAEAGTVQDAARRLLDLVVSSFGWTLGALWLVDDDGELLRFTEDWGPDDDRLVAFRRLTARLTFAPGAGLPGRTWASGQPAWIADIESDASFARRMAAMQAGLGSALAVPVIGPDGVLGVIELFSRDEREADAAQLEVLRILGRQVGQYVARAHAEERLAESEERNSAIVRAALDCVITMDHRGIVVDFNPAAEATFGCSREEAVGRELAELIVPPELEDLHRQALRRYAETGEARILGRRLELTGQRADGSRLPVELTITRVGSRTPPTFAGFIRDITERRRTEEEVARLLEREHAARLRAEEAERAARRVSEALQRSLLPPHLPAIPGVELGAAYRAGSEGSAVGGDFYDVFDLGEGRWGVAIGDVRGKGADAAAVTALARYTIRAAAVRESRPSAVLRVLNEALLREGPEGADFCTAIYALLDTRPARPSLRVATGGHPLPLVLRSAGEVAAAGRPGTLIGAVADPVLYDEDVTLGPGDAVVLYTDGVTESRTPEGRFGVDRLAAVLRSCAGLGADAVARRIEAAVADAPAHQSADDVALLVVRAEGDGQD